MKKYLTSILLLSLLSAMLFGCAPNSSQGAESPLPNTPTQPISSSLPVNGITTPDAADDPASAAPSAAPTAPPPSPTPTVTPSATASPEAAATPTATPSPTPKPTKKPPVLPEEREPELNEGISLSEAAYGIPSAELPVMQSIGFNLRATVTSGLPLTKVLLRVTDSSGRTFSGAVTFSAESRVLSYALNDASLTAEKKSIDSFALTDKLSVGTCLIELLAQDTAHSSPVLLLSRRFSKISGQYALTPNQFRDGYYETALAFFGDTEEFLFHFSNDDGRYIKQENAWRKAHLVTVKNQAGKNITVHRKAQASFEQAFQYMNTTLLRVRGNGFDTGIIPLSALAPESNGTYVSRFVSGKRFISHHAFGTAQDLNASQASNKNNIKNHKVIASEVALLDYEGILKDDNNNEYHSFIYRGSCTELCGGVPQTVVNYLLYELAYFRAGFGWGYYYSHTCDAMHFTLSEMSPDLHESENGGLRKVYAYAS